MSPHCKETQERIYTHSCLKLCQFSHTIIDHFNVWIMNAFEVPLNFTL